MKTIFKAILFVLISTATYNCETKNGDDYLEGYISGTFLCPETVNGHPGDTIRGFCISKEDRVNTPIMDFYTFHFPGDQFPIISEIYKYTYSGSNCGPKFFTDSIMKNYKVRIKFRYPNENEKKVFVCGPCLALDVTFPWTNFKQIIIEEISY
jgi:hypothetical protein